MTCNLIGIMGPGETASEPERTTAYALGAAIAAQGWGLVTGGRAVGVMEAASQGARAGGGWVVGILPCEAMQSMSKAVDIPIVTGMGQGRNVINVLSSRVVIACGLGAGTLSEMALAIKLGRPLIVLQPAPHTMTTLQAIASNNVWAVATVTEAIAQVQRCLDSAEDAGASQSMHSGEDDDDRTMAAE